MNTGNPLKLFCDAMREGAAEIRELAYHLHRMLAYQRLHPRVVPGRGSRRQRRRRGGW